MSLSPQTLSQDHLNLLRNDIIKFEFSPLVYQTIIEWGFEKPDGVTIKEHVEKKKIEQKAEESGINLGPCLKRNKTALEKEEFSSFDVTTLHDLLPVLCYDKVALTGRKEWHDKLKDPNSIEYLLKEIKSFRNDVSHEYIKAKQDPNIEARQKLLRKCIKTAGTLYSKDHSEIDAKVAEMDAKFEKLVHDTTNSYENAVRNVMKFVEKESAPFLLEKYSELFSVPLPGGLGKIGTTQIFESVNLSVTVEDKDDINAVKDVAVEDKDGVKKKKVVFSSNEISNNVTNKFVVINGGPGSGKTTLLKHLYKNILDNSVNGSQLSYEGIGRFRVPIYLECRTERQSNLRDFLKESIPNLCSHTDVIYDAFKEIDGKLFLIDGYDEVNDKSRELIKDAIDFSIKHNATCIVSGRVDAGNNFIRDLQKRNLSYDKMLIEPISRMSDKLSFLRRYGDKMGDCVDSDELVKSFENLNEAAQKVFFSPILLALFISLFLNNKSCLSQLHNEQSAYRAIKEIFSKEIEEKLREINVPNPKLTTKDILAVFSFYSLLLFQRKEYFFKEYDYNNLVRDCQQKLSKDVDFEKLLTCILTPETSLKQCKTLTYAFTHSTIQEYLAVEQIIKNTRECNIDWNSEQFSESSLRERFLEYLEVSTTHTIVGKEVQRYGNIIKLLMLESLANGHLTNYTRTFTAVLSKYFGPMGDSPVSPVHLLDLVSSSTCDPAIVSIVSDVLRDESDFELRYTRHIRPFAEVQKKWQTSVVILFEFDNFLTHTDCVNFGQLVSVLQDGSKIKLYFDHSYANYLPLIGEFYTQLNNCKCKVTAFTACVTSYAHLYIVMRLWGDERDDYDLYISTVSVCEVSFATLEEHRGKIRLKVKYTDDFPTNGSNHVTEKTILTITDIPTDGRENVYNIIKYLCPKSKQFGKIELVNSHLTDTDVNELLKKLEGEKIRTETGWRTKVKQRSVNENKSKNLRIYLADVEKREAEQREAEQRKIEQKKTKQQELFQLEAAQRIVSQLEAELREAQKREATQREAVQRKVSQLEAELREAQKREAAQREAVQRKVSQLEAELREAEQRESIFLKSIFFMVVTGFMFQFIRNN